MPSKKSTIFAQSLWNLEKILTSSGNYSRVPNKHGVFNSSRGRNFLPKSINIGSWIKVGGVMFCKICKHMRKFSQTFIAIVYGIHIFIDTYIQVICYDLGPSLVYIWFVINCIFAPNSKSSVSLKFAKFNKHRVPNKCKGGRKMYKN